MTVRSDVGFVFSTKDRVDFSRRSLASLDTCGGFDLVWVDGSNTPEGKAFPHEARLQNSKITEIHENITGGPDRAIQFGLRRLLHLGYPYCGLIENDVACDQGWFPRLMELFRLGQRDGLRVGAVTARTLESRVLCRRPEYAVIWNMGAGMVLFTRWAARIILLTYRGENARTLADFYRDRFGVDVTPAWEVLMGQNDRIVGCDWSYAKHLYRQGLCSLGTVPSLARNFDCDFESLARTCYVGAAATPTEHDKETFARLLLSASAGRGANRLGRISALTADSCRSTAVSAAARYSVVRGLLHAVISIRALATRLAGRTRSESASRR